MASRPGRLVLGGQLRWAIELAAAAARDQVARCLWSAWRVWREQQQHPSFAVVRMRSRVPKTHARFFPATDPAMRCWSFQDSQVIFLRLISSSSPEWKEQDQQQQEQQPGCLLWHL